MLTDQADWAAVAPLVGEWASGSLLRLPASDLAIGAPAPGDWPGEPRTPSVAIQDPQVSRSDSPMEERCTDAGCRLCRRSEAREVCSSRCRPHIPWHYSTSYTALLQCSQSTRGGRAQSPGLREHPSTPDPGNAGGGMCDVAGQVGLLVTPVPDLSAETRPASPAAPCAHQSLHASGGEGDAHHTHGRRVG